MSRFSIFGATPKGCKHFRSMTLLRQGRKLLRYTDVDSAIRTVHLVNVNHNMYGRCSSGLGGIFLDPIPVNRPDDPLNWF